MVFLLEWEQFNWDHWGSARTVQPSNPCEKTDLVAVLVQHLLVGNIFPFIVLIAPSTPEDPYVIQGIPMDPYVMYLINSLCMDPYVMYLDDNGCLTLCNVPFLVNCFSCSTCATNIFTTNLFTIGNNFDLSTFWKVIISSNKTYCSSYVSMQHHCALFFKQHRC